MIWIIVVAGSFLLGAVLTAAGFVASGKLPELPPEPLEKPICVNCKYYNSGSDGTPVCTAAPHPDGGYTLCAALNKKYDCKLFVRKR